MSAQTGISTDSTEQADHGAIEIRHISPRELRQALRRGWSDFQARPTHGVFLTMIYLFIAACVTLVGLRENLLLLLFPAIGGLALLGPIAACGLYELSRRREQGMDSAWWHVFDVLRAPSRGAIALMGLLLAGLFAAWLSTAVALYGLFFGGPAPASFLALLEQVFTTTTGWQLVLAGTAIGFVYSVVVFAATVISLPMMIQRRVGLLRAVGTSLRMVQANFPAMAVWYLTIVALLLAGMVPLLIGLGVVVPVLGHATWHLYRAAVD